MKKLTKAQQQVLDLAKANGGSITHLKGISLHTIHALTAKGLLVAIETTPHCYYWKVAS